jgi:hypothetical protein
MNAPIILYNERKAKAAYARYVALRTAERDDPSLADEECFQILVSDAYRSFETAFCATNLEIAE